MEVFKNTNRGAHKSFLELECTFPEYEENEAHVNSCK